jgi:hypothetical protein
MTTDELKNDPKLLSDEELQVRFDYMDEIRQAVFLGGESTLLSICDSLTRHIAALRESVLPWRKPDEGPEISDIPNFYCPGLILAVKLHGETFVRHTQASGYGDSELFDYDERQWVEDNIDGELIAWCYESDIIATLPETGGGE